MYRTTKLVPVTVHISSRELTLAVMPVTKPDATFVYASCVTCGWDSRRDPDGDTGLFKTSVEALDGVRLSYPL